MKKIISLSFFVLVATFTRAAVASTGVVDDYTRAVTAYVEAANREMVALHAKADVVAKAAGEQEKAGFEGVQRQLDECDRLLEQLTSSGQTNFDRVKSAYEREREDAVKSLDKLEKAKKG